MARRLVARLFVPALLAAGASGSALATREPKDCLAPNTTCSCREWTFAAPDWTVAGFAYRASVRYRAPQDAAPRASARVSFVVENRALDYQAECVAVGSRDDRGGEEGADGDGGGYDDGDDDGDDVDDDAAWFTGDTWYPCNQTGAAGAGLTSFRYDRPHDRFEVKQTWQCRHKGFNYRYQATGDAKATMVCAEQDWENPAWVEGEPYQVNVTECQPPQHTMRVPWKEISGM